MGLAELLEKMWDPRNAEMVVHPGAFKELMGKYRRRFSGYEQQDAQELLGILFACVHEVCAHRPFTVASFLVASFLSLARQRRATTKIHARARTYTQDLNRIAVKPYLQPPDSNGRPDSMVAEICWKQHMQRNISIISTLFFGQFKSLLICKTCGHESATFNPFNMLPVPLPESDTVYQSVKLWFGQAPVQGVPPAAAHARRTRLPLNLSVRMSKSGFESMVAETLLQAIEARQVPPLFLPILPVLPSPPTHFPPYSLPPADLLLLIFALVRSPVCSQV